MKNIISYLLLSKVEKKAFVNIFLIALLAMSSLLTANILYSDDLTRVTTGETFWNANGRPLASLISLVLQLGKPLTDISPLPQILALAIYALSAVYLGKLFQVDNLLLLTLCGTVFVLSPFNLQNFAFVFDSYTMSTAVLTSTLATLAVSLSLENHLPKKEKIISFSLSFILLLCSICLYQYATSVYLVTCFCYGLLQLLNRQYRKSLEIFQASTIIVSLSFITYIPLKSLYVGKDGYNSYHSQIVSFSEFPLKSINTLQVFWRNIQQLLGSGTINTLYYILFIITLLVIFTKAFTIQKKVTIAFWLKIFKKSLTRFILIIFYLLLIIVSVSGIILVMENPILEPRVMMGLTTLVTICCLFLSNEFFQKRRKLFKYYLIGFLVLLSIAFTNVSLTFGNVLYLQNVQDELIATLLISDITEIIPQLPIPPKHLSTAIVNTLDYTYANVKAYEKYPILKTITWYYLQPNVQFYTKMETLGFKFNPADYRDSTITGTNNEFVPKTEPILIRSLYKIYFERGIANNHLLIVVFENPNY